MENTKVGMEFSAGRKRGYLWLVSAVLLLSCIRDSEGHGRMIDPPARSSIWRERERYPGVQINTNYDDNGLNCGGRSYQWESAGGKCGVCGDKWTSENQIRAHEAGGIYAQGIIVRHYTRGDVIPIKIHVTASHKGYFEFRICPVNDVNTRATQACLDQNLLALANGDTKYYERRRAGIFVVNVQLPPSLTCTQCVLQWKWRTGNSWGTDPSGESCVGCGPQEQFYGCADVSISDSNQASDVTTTSGNGQATVNEERTTAIPEVVTVKQKRTTAIPEVVTVKQERTTAIPEVVTVKQEQTKTIPEVVTVKRKRTTTIPEVVTATQEPATTRAAPTTGASTIDYTKCDATPTYRNVPGMKNWCSVNCKANYCPQSHCDCSGKAAAPPRNCFAIPPHNRPSMNRWCADNCNHTPPYCPRTHCACV